MTSFMDIISSSKFRGIVAIIAAIVMYFTPDHIDSIIETILAYLGISQLVITSKKR